MIDGQADRLWAAVLDALRLRMARETFHQLLQGSTVVESGEGALTIGVAAHAVEWLERRLRGVIEQSAQQVAGWPVAVRFVAGRSPRREEERDDEEEGGETLPPERTGEPRAAPAGGLTPLDTYIRLKTAFRQRALSQLKGAPLSAFLCLALHLDADGMAAPGIETIMRETGYSRRAVCSALAELESLGLVTKRAGYHRTDRYAVNGYAWFGRRPAPVLLGESECGSRPRPPR